MIEMLVALATFGLVVVLLFGGVRFAGRTLAAHDRLIDPAVAAEPVRALVRRMIVEGHDFAGGPDRLRLVGPLPDALGGGELLDIQLGVEGTGLAASWRARNGGPSGRATLLDNVTGLELAYLMTIDNAKPEWRPMTEDRAKAPPLLVRLRINRNDARPVELTAAPGHDTARHRTTAQAYMNTEKVP